MENRREVIAQGKTVRQARLEAAKLLHVEDERLQVEVVDRGRRGLFGLFARLVRIRAWVRPERARCERRDVRPGEDGLAGVTGGVLRIYGPRGKGRAATVIPTHGVVLRVNGVAVSGPRQIREDERLDVELEQDVHPARMEVDLSSDGLSARVKVFPEITVHYELEDQSPQNVLQLLARGREEHRRAITAAHIEAALRERGITFGLDREEISRAAAAADGVLRVVARGQAVQEGSSGFVEYLFDRKPVEIVYEEDEKADYWERFVLPSVKPGDALAVVHPPVPGIPGTRVTGETILPRPVQEAVLRVKDGVQVSEDGQRAVASIEGRPVIEGRHEPHLRVIRLMVHPGDVDMRSGNLRFRGDLLVLGNVNEGMEVSAHGDITVVGSISGAKVTAGGKVICRGRAIGSRVSAGGLKSFYSRLAPLLDELGGILDGIIRETTRIRDHPANRRRLKQGDINRVVRLLVERRRQRLDALAGEYASALEAVDLPFPSTIRGLVDSVQRLTSGSVGRDGCIGDDLESIVAKREEIRRLLDAYPEHPGHIVCSYVQNSSLDAGGDIVVRDEGCFYSRLMAGGQVKVHGVFRGGEVSALGDVFIRETGSPGPSSGGVKVKTTTGASISIRKAYPETTVQVGGCSHTFETQMNLVRAFLGADGSLRVESSFGDASSFGGALPPRREGRGGEATS